MRIILGLLILGLVQRVHAASESKGMPNLFNDAPAMTLNHETIGRSCYSLRASEMDLDCNPAFLADEEKRAFRVNIIGNDKLALLNRYRNQLHDNDKVGVAADLLGRNEPIIAKTTASIWYQRDWWAVGYIPFRGGFSYLRRNPSYPEISAQVYRESEVFGKVGLFTSEGHHFRVGMQARYVQRDYILQQFAVFDAISDPALLEIQHQSALYLEPGVVYAWKTDWDPTLSAALTNLPVAQNGDQLPFQPIADIGFSHRLGTFLPQLRTTTHYTTRPDIKDVFRRLTWAATWDIEKVAATNVIFGKDLIGAGVSGVIEHFNLGISYKYERMAFDSWRTASVSTTTLEAGLVF